MDGWMDRSIETEMRAVRVLPESGCDAASVAVNPIACDLGGNEFLLRAGRLPQRRRRSMIDGVVLSWLWNSGTAVVRGVLLPLLEIGTAE